MLTHAGVCVLLTHLPTSSLARTPAGCLIPAIEAPTRPTKRVRLGLGCSSVVPSIIALSNMIGFKLLHFPSIEPLCIARMFAVSLPSVRHAALTQQANSLSEFQRLLLAWQHLVVVQGSHQACLVLAQAITEMAIARISQDPESSYRIKRVVKLSIPSELTEPSKEVLRVFADDELHCVSPVAEAVQALFGRQGISCKISGDVV
jgi:hypothetical protein